MEMVLLHNTIEHALLDVLVPLPVVGGEGGGEEGEEGEGGGEEGEEGEGGGEEGREEGRKEGRGGGR